MKCDGCKSLIVKSIVGEKIRPNVDDKRGRSEYWYCRKYQTTIGATWRNKLYPVPECIKYIQPEPKLKPCPFCGNSPEIFDCDFKIIHADSCFLTFLNGDNEEWLIGKKLVAWNTRQENN